VGEQNVGALRHRFGASRVNSRGRTIAGMNPDVLQAERVRRRPYRFPLLGAERSAPTALQRRGYRLAARAS
jgi:hypothetical protein